MKKHFLAVFLIFLVLFSIPNAFAQEQEEKTIEIDEIFEQALKIAYEISDDCLQSETLKEIAESLAETKDFKQARKIANKIGDDRCRTQALRYIADLSRESEDFERVNKAIKTTAEINDDYCLIYIQRYKAESLANKSNLWKNKHLAAYARSLAKANYFKSARKIANRIGDYDCRAEAFTYIADLSRKTEDFERAREAANQISDDYWRIKALIAIAEALADDWR